MLCRNYFETLPLLIFRCTHGGGRAVYIRCEQITVMRVSTLGIFPPDLMVVGHDVAKYTARPPTALSIF